MTNLPGVGRKSSTLMGQKLSLPNQTSLFEMNAALKHIGKIIVSGAFSSHLNGMRARQEFALARPEGVNWAKTIIGVWL